MSTPYTGKREHYGESDEIERRYWRVGEVAQMFRVNISLLHYWQKEFGMEVKRNIRGVRLFVKEDIEKFRTIYDLLKVERYTIEGAKRKFKNG